MRLCWLPFILALTSCGHGEDFRSDDRPVPSPLVGDSCSDDSDCDQHCARGGEFPDGFCTLQGCRANEECPEGTVCVDEWDGVCLYPCSEPLDCSSQFLGRSGYTCRRRDGYSTETTYNVDYWVCLGD